MRACNIYCSIRQLPEKMALGALLLECDNSDFWVALGCMSDNSALKLHALIRALHLDVSLAVAWAFMGQVLCLNCSFHSCFTYVHDFSYNFPLFDCNLVALNRSSGNQMK